VPVLLLGRRHAREVAGSLWLSLRLRGGANLAHSEIGGVKSLYAGLAPAVQDGP
jgi:hypothetical protein